MKIVRNNIIPFKGFKAVNLFGILFVRKDVTFSEIDLRHEEIHTKQYRELWYVGFIFMYLYFWIKNLFHYGFTHEAYRKIPFEQEAYENQYVKLYLKYRIKNAWKYYVV